MHYCTFLNANYVHDLLILIYRKYINCCNVPNDDQFSRYRRAISTEINNWQQYGGTKIIYIRFKVKIKIHNQHLYNNYDILCVHR